MKIVMLSRLYAPHRGGVERHLDGLCSELLSREHLVTIVTEQFDPKLSLNERLGGVQVIRIPLNRCGNKLGMWSWMWENRNLFASTDLVHAHDVFWWYFQIRLRFPNIRSYITFHGYENIDGPRFGAVVIRRISEALSDGSICIGEWMRKWYGQKVGVVSYGAADSKMKPLPVKKSAVFVGRLESDTGIIEYIEAVKMLGKEFVFDIYGEGPLKKDIEAGIKKYPWIKLRGLTKSPGTEFAKHRYVFGSQYLSMLEAQQIGRQVFAYSGYPLKADYLKSFPTYRQLICFDSSEELATLFKKLGKDQEKQNINKANTWASKQTWKKLADQYEALWQK